jgi:uncharacterized membrane protein YgdD (TMEM256/DUF423 family)
MRKRFIRIGGIVLMLAVILGAFGAHGLEQHLSTDDITTYKTGVEYQFYHGFGILIIALLIHYRKTSFLNYAAWAFLVGIIMFSGSLYFFTAAKVLNMDAPFWVGPITPLGGTLFIIGWICLIIATFQDADRKPRKSQN